jgi:hypothetical protein
MHHHHGWMDGWSVDKTPWFSFSSCSQLISPIAESSTDLYGMASKWMNGKSGGDSVLGAGWVILAPKVLNITFEG